MVENSVLNTQGKKSDFAFSFDFSIFGKFFYFEKNNLLSETNAGNNTNNVGSIISIHMNTYKNNVSSSIFNVH